MFCRVLVSKFSLDGVKKNRSNQGVDPGGTSAMNTSSQNIQSESPVLVFGEGSASVFLISQLLKRNEKVIWVKDSGSQILPIMPYVKSELALGAMLDSYQFVSNEVFAHPIEKGTAHRVFRNKGFKLPVWKRTSNLEAQQSAFEEMIWKPEQTAIGITELRVAGLSALKIEESLREAIEVHPALQKVEMAPVMEFEILDQGGKLQFTNEMTVEFKQLYYCGPLSELKAIPKLSAVLKAQVSKAKTSSSVSALQVVFHHAEPLLQNFETGLVIPMNRDSGESFDRDVLGYFVEPTRSIWTVFLQADEVEENHEIMKKLRKMKQSLNKAFDGPDFLPLGKKDFMSTVDKEQVRFEPGFVVIEGEFKQTAANADYVLMNDSFGLTYALEQIAYRFDIPAMQFDAETMDSKEILESIQSVDAAPDVEAQF
jgi:hypothetical protein